MPSLNFFRTLLTLAFLVSTTLSDSIDQMVGMEYQGIYQSLKEDVKFKGI